MERIVDCYGLWKKVSVPIIFVPDKNGIGTSYIIDSGEIKY